jgi:hypothetical protein
MMDPKPLKYEKTDDFIEFWKNSLESQSLK